MVKKSLTKEQEERAFGGWWKITGIAKNGKKILRREPTSSNAKIVCEIYKRKGAKKCEIKQIKR